MNTILESSRPVANSRTRELPGINRLPIPTFLDDAPGFECVAKFRELYRNASDARAEAVRAEANIDRAADADAEAEADALIAGDPPPKKTATAKAVADADAAFAKANAAIRASNKFRPQVIEAIRGEPGLKLAEADAKATEAYRLTVVKHLEQAAEALAQMQGHAATPRWINEVRGRSTIDLAIASMPSPRADLALILPDGSSPMHALAQVQAMVDELGEERESA